MSFLGCGLDVVHVPQCSFSVLAEVCLFQVMREVCGLH